MRIFFLFFQYLLVNTLKKKVTRNSKSRTKKLETEASREMYNRKKITINPDTVLTCPTSAVHYVRTVEQFESAVRDRVVMRAGALPPRISLEFNVAAHGQGMYEKKGRGWA